MKVHLMYCDSDFDATAELPPNETALRQDLDLDIILDAMANGDRFLLDVARRSLLCGMHSVESIRYRQEVLRDCINNSSTIRSMYAIAVEAIESKQQNWIGIFTTHPGSILYSANRMIDMYLPLLERLKKIASSEAGKFGSEGFLRLFAMLREELSDDYFEELHAHLRYLAFREGVLISARLGKGNESVGHTLRKAKGFGKDWFQRILFRRSPSYSFSISPRDDAGCRALGELRDRGINLAANALGQSADHIDSYFKRLRMELGFFVGCINLQERLLAVGERICFPEPRLPRTLSTETRGLSNPCLSIHTGRRSVGNDVNALGKNPVIVTGANEGGKSTFLRSIGVAQLMMQAGMFVAAEFFATDICDGVFTHYRRKEDRSMTSGKLDEELARMDGIADLLKPSALILFNESFAATNEREGTDIARQIVEALIEKDIRIFFVTHLYSFAAGFSREEGNHALLLKAESAQDGTRTFRIIEGPPSEKSRGEDLYRKVFGEAGAVRSPSPATQCERRTLS